jgi:putative transposase
MAESFVGTLQLELLDRRRWQSQSELASAIFEYIEALFPRRRHSSIGNLSPVEFESRYMSPRRSRHDHACFVEDHDVARSEEGLAGLDGNDKALRSGPNERSEGQ